MPNFTPRLNLIKPLDGESFSVEHANGNADKIDASVYNHTSNFSNPHNVTSSQINKLADNFTDNAAAMSAYPQGISIFRSNVSSLGFPYQFSTIQTSNSNGYGYQVTSNNTATSNISFRVWNSTTSTLAWGPWLQYINSSNKATQAQAIAMTNDTTYMTPLRTADSIGVHANNNTHVFWVGNATGTNTLSTTYTNITSYTQGLAISFSVATNTTLAATLRVNSLAYVPILNSRGTAVANLRAGGVYTVRYSGTNFILQGEGGEYGNATAAQVLAPNTFGTENGLVTGTMVNRGVFNLGLGVAVPPGFYSGGNAPSGRREATGNGSITFGNTELRVNVSGLAFTPYLIQVQAIIQGQTFRKIYNQNSAIDDFTYNNSPNIANTGAWIINSNGFSTSLGFDGGITSGTFNYIAYG